MNEYEARQQARRERLEQAADNAQSEANATHARARSMASVIPFGQPILVDHYSAGRDRRYRARIHNTFGKAFALNDKAADLRAKAEAVGTGGISSDDPDAIDKLRAQLVNLRESQERMVVSNRVIRKHAGNADAQIAALVALGYYTEEQARSVIAPDHVGRIGFPSYALQNNSANIRRIEDRIKQLEKAREAVDVEEVCDGYTYREDVADNRIWFVFDGKPDEATRAILRRYAFKWSPSRPGKPHIRQLTNAGRHAAKMVRKELAELKKTD
ncbi:DUF3560 domain-containing protein [Burkholderia cenocepacia]|uniref:DUF3560 domain-containing protein n=1 Tax=Burkholderia cenocepacia TaxID=95486 RepID=UPI000F59C57B|nr:DUF3560 domain-containing protein [Burkholderia cenocepacia]RQU83933.1 DUF3560 domain-containing protein [Burkholderia cenocepacia]